MSNFINADKEIPAKAGLGLRSAHYHRIADEQPEVAWLEVHTENLFGDGGLPHDYLEKIRQHYPLSLHGVGLSLGSVDPLSLAHLKQIKQVIERYQPGLVSEHICWGSVNGRHLNDLLPLPYTEEAVDHLCHRIQQAQDYLACNIIIENVSSYLSFNHSTMPEWEFINAISQKSGCGILLDINNVYVNAYNHQFNPADFIQAIPVDAVKEMHLAGYEDLGHTYIDTHGHAPCDAVWDLYQQALKRFGAVPSLIEWDTDVPELDVLLTEANKAQHYIDALAV